MVSCMTHNFHCISRRILISPLSLSVEQIIRIRTSKVKYAIFNIVVTNHNPCVDFVNASCWFENRWNRYRSSGWPYSIVNICVTCLKTRKRHRMQFHFCVVVVLLAACCLRRAGCMFNWAYADAHGVGLIFYSCHVRQFCMTNSNLLYNGVNYYYQHVTTFMPQLFSLSLFLWTEDTTDHSCCLRPLISWTKLLFYLNEGNWGWRGDDDDHDKSQSSVLFFSIHLRHEKHQQGIIRISRIAFHIEIAPRMQLLEE